MNPVPDSSLEEAIPSSSIPRWGDPRKPMRLTLGGRLWDLPSVEADPACALNWILRLGIAWRCMRRVREDEDAAYAISEIFRLGTPGLFLVAMKMGLIRSVAEMHPGDERYPHLRRIGLLLAGQAAPLVIFHAALAKHVLPRKDRGRRNETDDDYDKGEYLLYRAFSGADYRSALADAIENHPHSRGNLFLRTPEEGKGRPSVSTARMSWAGARLENEGVRLSMEATIRNALLVTGIWGTNLGFYLAAGTFIIGDPLWILEYQLRSKGIMAQAIARDGASIRRAEDLHKALTVRRWEPLMGLDSLEGGGIRCNHVA